MTSDGEAVVLHQMYDESVMNLFQEISIDYVKLGPSATSKEQAWDVGTIFRDGKKSLKYMTDHNIDPVTPTLSNNIKAYFIHLKFAFPGIVDLTTDFINKVVFAICTVTHILNKDCKKYKMEELFSKV